MKFQIPIVINRIQRRIQVKIVFQTTNNQDMKTAEEIQRH
jgi:hypothetical protein